MAADGIAELKASLANDDPPFFTVTKVFKAMWAAMAEPPLEGRASVKLRDCADDS